MLKLAIVILLISSALAAPKSHEDHFHPYLEPVKTNARINPLESTSNYWIKQAQETLNDKIKNKLNTNTAKNVIMFLGDGMSIPTIATARVYQGGEEELLAFDKFPWAGLSKTYAVDRQVADSANTATAYLCGSKANYGTMGVGPEVLRSDCEGQANTANHVHSIAYHSQNLEKLTGIVTTARVTHASPGGAYAHTANRDWESDTNVLSSGKDPSVCADIAHQLVYGETGKRLDVILGGGRAKFLPSTVVDEEGQKGTRTDGANLIEEWLSLHDDSQYVWNRSSLLSLDNSTKKVLGLFGHDHLDYNLERDKDLDPSLEEMTEAAIKILSKGKQGYFLFVEGARIDMAHHETRASVSLDETLEFSKAVQKAVDMTNEEDTLIVVTSDHSHTLSYSGYAKRGNDILGFAGTASDKKPYYTLSYANGPGYQPPETDGTRHDATNDDYTDKDYLHPATAPLSSETHGGDDVGIFARGPYAHLFSGVLEQNVIPHLMSYASCVGNGLTACGTMSKSASKNHQIQVHLLLFSFILIFFHMSKYLH